MNKDGGLSPGSRAASRFKFCKSMKMKGGGWIESTRQGLGQACPGGGLRVQS